MLVCRYRTLNREVYILSDDVYMPFGTHRGQPIGELGRGYLNWLLEQEWLDDHLRNAIEEECATRDRSYITD